MFWFWPFFPFWPFARKNYAILPAKSGAVKAMAAIHREDFSRPWTDGEFRDLMAQKGVFAFIACEEGKGEGEPAGFVLARLAAGEAEILTIAVARRARREGLGRKLMEAVMRKLHHDRAESLFLEVDAGNTPALALYRRLGFREVGKRKNYYLGKDGARSTALVMRLDLA